MIFPVYSESLFLPRFDPPLSFPDITINAYELGVPQTIAKLANYDLWGAQLYTFIVDTSSTGQCGGGRFKDRTL